MFVQVKYVLFMYVVCTYRRMFVKGTIMFAVK